MQLLVKFQSTAHKLAKIPLGKQFARIRELVVRAVLRLYLPADAVT